MNSRVFVVCVIALMAVSAFAADTEVAASAAAAADTETKVAAASATSTEVHVDAAAEAKAKADAEAAAAAKAKADAEAAAKATAASAAAATAEAEKPKEDAKDKKKETKPASTSFKPVMINRASRHLDVSQRSDIRYTDGGRAEIISFGPRPERVGVDAEVVDTLTVPVSREHIHIHPLTRRFHRWTKAGLLNKKDKKDGKKEAPKKPEAPKKKEDKKEKKDKKKDDKNKKPKKFVTPRYVNEARRDDRDDRRYVSYVPQGAFYAPRIPTHFEPMYQDEYNILNGIPNRRGPAYATPFPFPPYADFADFADFAPAFGGRAYQPVEYERSIYENHPNRAIPRAFEQFGLPSFPALPDSAARHLAGAPARPRASADVDVEYVFEAPFDAMFDAEDWDAALMPFADDAAANIVRAANAAAASAKKAAKPMKPIASKKPIVHAPVQYPSGEGPRAALAKLDFALGRLDFLNTQLRAAEARLSESRANIKAANGKLKRLNAIRAKLQALAQQISVLEQKVGRDPAVQAEIAHVTHAEPTFLPPPPQLYH